MLVTTGTRLLETWHSASNERNLDVRKLDPVGKNKHYGELLGTLGDRGAPRWEPHGRPDTQEDRASMQRTENRGGGKAEVSGKRRSVYIPYLVQ